MQTDNQCAASLIRCLAEVLREGPEKSIGPFKDYDYQQLSSQLHKARNPGGARHFTLTALEQAADRLEERA